MVRTAADILADLQTRGDLPIPAPTTTDEVAILRWEDPPPRDLRGGSRYPAPESKYAKILRELTARPGRWALIFVGSKGRATTIADAIRYGERARSFDAVTRGVDGRTRTYARYVGDEGLAR